MEQRSGRVVNVRNGMARIRFAARPACSNCARGLGCGLGPLISLLGRQSRQGQELQLRASGLQPGQAVACEIPAARIAAAAAVAYLVPLMAMFAGAVTGRWLAGGHGDFPAVIGAGAGLVLGWLVLRMARRSCDIRGEHIVVRGMSRS